MQINTNSLVSIAEARQDFSRLERLVDENGVAIIVKNDVPHYIVMEFGRFEKEELDTNEEIDIVARRVLAKNRHSLEDLSK